MKGMRVHEETSLGKRDIAPACCSHVECSSYNTRPLGTKHCHHRDRDPVDHCHHQIDDDETVGGKAQYTPLNLHSEPHLT